MTVMHAATHVSFDLDSLDALRHSRPRGMLSLSRFLRRFAYSAEQIERLSNMPAGSARANPFAVRVQRFMSGALDVVALRMLHVTDLDEAVAWFKGEPLAAFEGLTPEQVVARGGGSGLAQFLSRHPPVH